MNSGSRASLAMRATRSMSSTLSEGLPSVSAQSALVLDVIARAKFSGSSASTNTVSMPSLRKLTSSWVWVPPYSVRAATIWSPASTTLSRAAIPLDTATAARPPSSAAMESED